MYLKKRDNKGLDWCFWRLIGDSFLSPLVSYTKHPNLNKKINSLTSSKIFINIKDIFIRLTPIQTVNRPFPERKSPFLLEESEGLYFTHAWFRLSSVANCWCGLKWRSHSSQWRMLLVSTNKAIEETITIAAINIEKTNKWQNGLHCRRKWRSIYFLRNYKGKTLVRQFRNLCRFF